MPDLAPALLGETYVAAAYEAAGPGPLPIAASVIKRHTPQHPWIAMVDGFDIANLTGRFDINSNGRLRYFYDVLTNVFGAVCTTVGTPLVVLDVPRTACFRRATSSSSTTTPRGTGSRACGSGSRAPGVSRLRSSTSPDASSARWRTGTSPPASTR